MARFGFVVSLSLVVTIVLAPAILHAQIPPSTADTETYTNTSTTTDGPFAGTPKFTGYGIVNLTMSWTAAGAGSGCTIRLEGANVTPPPTVDTSWTRISTSDLGCDTSAGTVTYNAPTTSLPYQWVRVYVSNLDHKSAAPFYSVQFSLVGTVGSASSFQFFGVPGMPIVQGAFAQYQVSPTAVYVSALNGGNLGTDACAAINYAIANSLFPGQTVVVDLQGDQPCFTNPFSPSGGAACSGNVLIGPGANYHLQGSSPSWVIPTHCRVIFTGQGIVGGIAGASIVSACVSGDLGCTSTFPTTGVALACFGAGGLCVTSSASATIQFDSVIVGGTFDCRYVSGCIGIQNYNSQENSGVFGAAIVGWGNGGIALDIEYNQNSGVPTTSAANSTYEHLQINNQVRGPCTLSATGIRISSSGNTMPPPSSSFPRKISDVTITNGGCSSGPPNVYPNDGIQVGGGAGILLSAIHIEHTNRAAINVGIVTTGTGDTFLPTAAVSLDEVSCANTLNNANGDCVRISYSGSGSPLAVSTTIHSISASVAKNVINDQKATQIPTSGTSASGVVSEYVTDSVGSVYKDSSYVNQERVSGIQYPGSFTAHSVLLGEGTSSFGTAGGTALTGQILTYNNGLDPTANSPGISGRVVSTGSDTILCDSTTAIRDRGATVQYASSSASV